MRKLLMCIMVLGMTATVANAGLIDLRIASIGPDRESTEPLDPKVSEITIDPSTWLDIDIVYDDQGSGLELFSFGVLVTVEGPGTIDCLDLTEPDGVWLTSGSLRDTTEMVAGKQWFIGRNGAELGLVPGSIPDLNVAIDHIMFHCDAEGEVTITMENWEGPNGGFETIDVDGEVVGISPALTIHQTPEPMTLALLGLGGLGLLRRRRS